MQLKQAINYAKELGALKFFPSGAAAVTKIGEIIAASCKNDTEAEWLVAEMLSSFDEWPGPRIFKSVYNKRFNPEVGPVFRGWGETPPTCEICNNNGVIWSTDRYYRCECGDGESITDQYLQEVNSRTPTAKLKRGEKPGLNRITVADVNAVMAGKVT